MFIIHVCVSKNCLGFIVQFYLFLCSYSTQKLLLLSSLPLLFFWGGDFTVVVFLTFWVNMKFSILITRIPDWSPELGEDVIHRILCDMIKQLIFWRLLLNRKLINNLRAEWIPMTRDTGHLFTQSPLPTDTGRMLKKQGHIRNSYSASCYLPG